jgi:hypothetical protein
MNTAARPQAGGERMTRLEAALRERAALLRPPETLLERALQRCAPRTGPLEAPLFPSAAPGLGTSALVPNQAGGPGDLVPLAPVSVALESGIDPTPQPMTLLVANDPLAPVPSASARLHAELPTVITTAADLPAATPSTATVGFAPANPASAPTLISHADLPPRAPSGDASSGANAVILPSGRIIAGYRIEGQIGSGGMGQVYRATQLSMNRQVAFKVLAPKLAGNPRFRERFLREARAAGRLHHPNLIAVHDVGEADGLMFFSMELVEGQSLKDLLAERGTVPETRALELTRQTLEALRYAHGNGLIHRDIKPDNLMLTTAGVVKVADLGLSRSADAEVAGEDLFKTQAGAIMGTPHYMAPEQARDAHSVDHRADLYAVGATLYHLVCGTTPFTGTAPMEVVIRAGTQPLTFPEPGPTPSMRVLIARLMAKKPEERYATAAEAVEAVVRLRRRTSESGGGDRAEQVATAIARARGRRLRRVLRKGGWIAGGLAALLLVLLALAALTGSWQWSDKRAEVRRLCEQRHYAQAHLALDLFNPGMNPLAAGGAAVAEARLAVDREWDEWAQAEVKPVFDAFREQAAVERWNDAFAILADVEDDWKSPQVRRELDTYREQVKLGLRKAAGQGAPPRSDESTHAPALPGPTAPAGGAAAPKPLEALGERLREQVLEAQTRALAEFWSGFDAVPADALTLSGEVARFSATGTAHQRAAAHEERPLLHRGLNVTVRFDGKAGAAESWGIALGAGRTLTASLRGLVITGSGAEQVLQPPSPFGNQVQFMLRRSGTDLEVRAARGSEWQSLHATTAEQLTLSWRAGAGAIEVRLKPLLRRE